MRKLHLLMVVFISLLVFSSCSDYLDVVPDNTTEVSHMFQTREKAYGALGTCYNYLPYSSNYDSDMILAGDEYVGRLDRDFAGAAGRYKGTRLMRGFQNQNNPILNYWTGGNGGTDLYEGIRMCNLFIENIVLVPDMTDEERSDWIAQANALKAFYHFWLIKHYGPIIIADKNIEASEGEEAVAQFRQPVDSCFSYVVNLLDKAIVDLNDTREENTYGQIDKMVALSIKAKVLTFAASPLFNGNAEFYSTFADENSTPYFSLTYDETKWAKALKALNEAIEFAESTANRSMFTYTDRIRAWDEEDWDKSTSLQYVYNARYAVLEQWNDELIWGYSKNDIWGGNTMQTICNMRSFEDPSISTAAQQNMAASYRMAELFHTKNGVPIEDDLTFDYQNKHKIVTIPDDDNYMTGVMQPLEKTVKLHLDREPRFYAWLGVDRGIFRGHETKNDLQMRLNEIPGGKAGTGATNFYATGIAIKKWIHPASRTTSRIGVTRYPRPLFRLADLYLLRAEVSNELDGPSQLVFDDLNKIRSRAGLPNVEDVYSNYEIVREVNKHHSKEGLREIIHTERLIELSFEGHRYYDILRWKKAARYFSSPIYGWDVDKSKAEEFYVLGTKQPRTWESPRNYLFPVNLNELTLNANLKQNPGWGR